MPYERNNEYIFAISNIPLIFYLKINIISTYHFRVIKLSCGEKQ